MPTPLRSTTPAASSPAGSPAGIAPAGALSLAEGLAAGVDQALRTGDDRALFAVVANLTAGLADAPALPCASSPTRRPGTDATPCVEAQSHQVGTGTAGEGFTSPSPATSDAPAETFDLRCVAADLREGTRDYLLRHDLAWIEPCPVCDSDMERVPCSDCDETGFVRGPGGRYDIRTCDTCAGSGWRMRCTGCLSFDSGAL